MRKIRSYVKREGRFTHNQKKAFEMLWPKYGLSPDKVLNLNTVFGREVPKILEIGFGDGKALLEMALARQAVDFIGVEVYRTGVSQLLMEIEKHQVSNVRVFCHDAVEVLETAIEDSSLDAVLVYFADPWPKTRHKKRRIIQLNFVSQIAHKLKLGGILHLATDWQDYAQHMLDVMSEMVLLKNTAGEGMFSERPPHRPMTKYERRAKRLGHGIWDLIFERVDYN